MFYPINKLIFFHIILKHTKKKLMKTIKIIKSSFIFSIIALASMGVHAQSGTQIDANTYHQLDKIPHGTSQPSNSGEINRMNTTNSNIGSDTPFTNSGTNNVMGNTTADKTQMPSEFSTMISDRTDSSYGMNASRPKTRAEVKQELMEARARGELLQHNSDASIETDRIFKY